MCHKATQGRAGAAFTRFAALFLVGAAAFSQVPPELDTAIRPDWRRIGNTAFEAGLASLATGPVERVWFDAAGARLYALTPSGQVFASDDFESWNLADEPPAAPEADEAPLGPERSPEPGAILRAGGRPGRVYALGRAVYRSDDNGLSWANLTEYRGYSIVGDGLADLAVSPSGDDQLAVAGRFGVWRSLDGGMSWTGLNDSLPNLPVRRLLAAPTGGEGARILVDGIGPLEWAPGEREAWRPAARDDVVRETAMRQALSVILGQPIRSVAILDEYVYAGAAEGGRLWTSSDRGGNWREFRVPGAGSIEKIFAVPGARGVAVAAAAGAGDTPVRVLRTANGGIFWDDATADLPDAAALGITADLASGAIYAATTEGVFFTIADLRGAGPVAGWRSLGAGLPRRPAVDAVLDRDGNQLYVLLDGAGMLSTMAPHRFLEPALASAADWGRRAAAPGSLFSILGRRVEAARAGGRDVPILAVTDAESQIQVPFEITGSALSLALRDGGSASLYTLGVPLASAAPAIFVDPDGSPLILDADSGVLLDALRPARSGARVQILATGLGRVRPAWPTGMAAPLEDPPGVVAEVRVYLDGAPVEVTSATLAPGYVGFYLVEIRIPDIVNAGPAEVYLDAGGNQSNRTRVYLEP